MRMHPRHEELDYVVYRMGLSVYRKAPRVPARDQTWTRQAVNTWTGFALRFPESEHLEDVQIRLDECRERLGRKELAVAKFYRRRGAWVAVSGRAGEMVAAYPKSEALGEGLALLAEAQAWLGEADQAQATLVRLGEVNPEEVQRVTRRVARARPELDE